MKTHQEKCEEAVRILKDAGFIVLDGPSVRADEGWNVYRVYFSSDRKRPGNEIFVGSLSCNQWLRNEGNPFEIENKDVLFHPQLTPEQRVALEWAQALFKVKNK